MPRRSMCVRVCVCICVYARVYTFTHIDIHVHKKNHAALHHTATHYNILQHDASARERAHHAHGVGKTHVCNVLPFARCVAHDCVFTHTYTQPHAHVHRERERERARARCAVRCHSEATQRAIGCVYTHKERERDRKRERERGRERERVEEHVQCVASRALRSMQMVLYTHAHLCSHTPAT